MNEHFTRDEITDLAYKHLGVFLADERWSDVKAMLEDAVAAIDKKREAQGAVATVTSNSLSDYSEISRTYQAPIPIGTKLYTHALPAQLAEQPIKLYADSSNPDMFNRDLLDAAGNRYTIMTPTMCQFDIDASALRAAGLEMKIDGMEPAPDGSSRAKMYWCKVDGQPAEPVNAEYGYWSQVIEMFVERLNHGPQTVEASDVLALLSDCQYLENLSRAQAAPAVGVPVFPERIMRQLTIMADRVGDEFHGPWEDGDGEPLQDDAEAAIAWIASAQPQQKEG